MALSFMAQAGLTELEKIYATKATTGRRSICVMKVHSIREHGGDTMVKMSIGMVDKNEDTIDWVKYDEECWTMKDTNTNGKFTLFPVLPPYTEEPHGLEIHWLPDSLVEYTPDLHNNVVHWEQPEHGIPNVVKCDLDI